MINALLRLRMLLALVLASLVKTRLNDDNQRTLEEKNTDRNQPITTYERNLLNPLK